MIAKRVVALLDMLHFGLKHPSDYVALHESVAGEVHRLELKRVRSRVIYATNFELSAQRSSARKFCSNDRGGQ